jgi:hypothetical protein
MSLNISQVNHTLNSSKRFVAANINYLRGVIIFLILFNSKVPDGYLQFWQTTIGRVLFAIGIALLVYVDAVLGMLFTVYYLFIMNEYNKRFKTKVDNYINLRENFNQLNEVINQDPHNNILNQNETQNNANPPSTPDDKGGKENNIDNDLLFNNVSDYTITDNVFYDFKKNPTCRHNYNL